MAQNLQSKHEAGNHCNRETLYKHRWFKIWNWKISQVNNNNNNNIKYFLPDHYSDADKKASDEITKQLQKEFKDVFKGIGCFDGKFSLQDKPDSKPFQVCWKHIAYSLQQPFKEESEHLQQQYSNAPLGIDESSEWCKSLVLVPKLNCKLRLCLDPAKTKPSANKTHT